LTIEDKLDRIAGALEAIAAQLGAAGSVTIDGVEHITHPTLTKPPLAWFDAGNGCAVAVDETHDDASGDAAWIRELARQEAAAAAATKTAQTTWEWLGITPPAKRTRSKVPDVEDVVTAGKNDALRDIPARKKPGPAPGSRRGRPLRCGRCRREGRARMNHSNRCVECQHEEWWDE